MKYLCLIHMPADFEPDPSEKASIGESYVRFDDAHADRIRTQGRLVPADSATVLRVRSGKTMLSDGPFAESKEVVAGFYLIECADLDEALACAAEIPSARYGSIEIRPLVEDWTPASETWRF
ncbi:MAG: YciI family protein [Vulcanimicrobiaceae bacterium]